MRCKDRKSGDAGSVPPYVQTSRKSNPVEASTCGFVIFATVGGESCPRSYPLVFIEIADSRDASLCRLDIRFETLNMNNNRGVPVNRGSRRFN